MQTMTTTPPGKRAEMTLAEEVYKRLRADILISRHPPGSSLRLDKLKTQYGVGVTPLREALSQLVARGLTVTEGKKGSRVASASVVDLTDIASIRRDIEGTALRRAIEIGDDIWESNLVAARHRLILLERSKDDEESNKETWEIRHRDLHEHLIAGCNSPWLIHLNGLLYDQFDRYRNLSNKYRLWDKRVSLEHKNIVDAALARDAKLAVRLLQKHIDHAAEVIIASMADTTD